jgi:hypothetical protein
MDRFNRRERSFRPGDPEGDRVSGTVFYRRTVAIEIRWSDHKQIFNYSVSGINGFIFLTISIFIVLCIAVSFFMFIVNYIYQHIVDLKEETLMADLETKNNVVDAAEKAKEKIEKGAVDAYKAVEEGVVDTYKKIENAVVDSYKKIEDDFVDKFLREDDETVEETKDRINDKLNKKDK